MGTHAPPASCDDVIPTTLSTQLFGQNVVEAQVVWGEILEAVLALVRVAQKQVASRERRMSPVLVHELLLGEKTNMVESKRQTVDGSASWLCKGGTVDNAMIKK